MTLNQARAFAHRCRQTVGQVFYIQAADLGSVVEQQVALSRPGRVISESPPHLFGNEVEVEIPVEPGGATPGPCIPFGGGTHGSPVVDAAEHALSQPLPLGFPARAGTQTCEIGHGGRAPLPGQQNVFPATFTVTLTKRATGSLVTFIEAWPFASHTWSVMLGTHGRTSVSQSGGSIPQDWI